MSDNPYQSPDSTTQSSTPNSSMPALWSEAVGIAVRTFLPLLLIFIMYMIVSVLASFVVAAIPVPLVAAIVSLIIQTALGAFLYLLLAAYYLQKQAGADNALATAMTIAQSKFMSGWGASLLQALITIVIALVFGLILYLIGTVVGEQTIQELVYTNPRVLYLGVIVLVVAFMAIYIRFSFPYHAIADKGMKAVESIQASVNMTRGRITWILFGFVPLLVLAVVMALLGESVMMSLMQAMQEPSAAIGVAVVALAFIMMISAWMMAMMALVYRVISPNA